MVSGVDMNLNLLHVFCQCDQSRKRSERSLNLSQVSVRAPFIYQSVMNFQENLRRPVVDLSRIIQTELLGPDFKQG